MSTQAKAAQEFVPIQEIKDGILVLKDGSLRAILLASSINFSLKSDDEKTAILAQFQDFLNSLDFSVQIYSQSRRLDIIPYINMLEEQEKTQANDLLKIQTQEYMEFIKNFTENVNIMTKHFFVVIPYSPAVMQNKTGINLLSRNKPTGEETKVAFEENRTQLEQRMAVVEQGLIRTGVRIANLGTEEVVELFYKIFNPGETNKPMQTN